MSTTFFLRYKLKVYDTNKELLAEYPEKLTFYLPYFDWVNHPNTGTLISLGFERDLYADLTVWCPDILLPTLMSLCPIKWDKDEYPSFPPSSIENYYADITVRNRWTNWIIFNTPETVSGSSVIWSMEFDNGKVLTYRQGTGYDAYETLEDFINGDVYLTSGLSGNSQCMDIFYYNYSGAFSIIGYKSVDAETGDPNTFAYIDFRGASVTSNSLTLNYYRENISANNAILAYLFEGSGTVETSSDPYAGLDEDAPPQQGEASGPQTGDDIDFPDVPVISASATGFITMFSPSITDLNNLASYMWSSSFDENAFKKIFADPMDCILGLSIVPGPVPVASSAIVKVGNLSTGVSMPRLASQYYDVDCGSIQVKGQWGGYLDYEPYTKLSLYLPYMGVHPISADEVMGKTITLKYRIDALSGACSAYLKCGDSVLYTFHGQCGASVPISGRDWTQMVNGVLNIAGAGLNMVVSGGTSAPSMGQVASDIVNIIKPNIQKSGSLSGAGGLLDIQTPYLIAIRPRMIIPGEGQYAQNKMMGYPSYKSIMLSTLSGYTEIEKIHLENIPATDTEIAEIENLLQGGVIL